MFAASSTIALPTSAAALSGGRGSRANSNGKKRTVRRATTLRVVARSIAEPTAPSASSKAGDRQRPWWRWRRGLGMASRRQRGVRVTILEKNPDTGGRCRSESFEGGGEGYRFDTGPSLMLLPDRYREQFTAVGKKLEVQYACAHKPNSPTHMGLTGNNTNPEGKAGGGRRDEREHIPRLAFHLNGIARVCTPRPNPAVRAQATADIRASTPSLRKHSPQTRVYTKCATVCGPSLFWINPHPKSRSMHKISP